MASLFVIILILAAVSYFFLLQKAVTFDRVVADNLRLLEENRRIHTLAEELERLKSWDRQIRKALGASLEIDGLTDTAVFDIPREVFRNDGFFDYYNIDFRVPVEGLVSRGYQEQPFPWKSHTGIDLAVPTGTLINAASDGWAVFEGWHPRYGNFLLLQHPGDYLTFYGHLSSSLVQVGEKVAAGEPVAVSGNSGRSSAPHLHFEIRHRGGFLDPALLIPDLQPEIHTVDDNKIVEEEKVNGEE